MGVAELAKAYEDAMDRRRNPWEFALTLEQLVAHGLTVNDLRWLVCEGYVEHGCELTTFRDGARRFRTSRGLVFEKKTCFVLTDSGAAFAAGILDEPMTICLPGVEYPDGSSVPVAPKPQWDGQERVLRVGQWIVKEFRAPSPDEETVLRAFQRRDWPQRIDDPLGSMSDQDPKDRLQETIRCLNQHHQRHLIHFHGDSSGTRIYWESVDDDATVALPFEELLRRSARLAA